MTTEITVTLPDRVYRNAVRLAQLTQREVGDVLTDTLALSLPELSPEADASVPISDLNDADVLALTTLELPSAQDRQLSDLLARQQAGNLPPQERIELAVLMQVYEMGLLRKAQALQEAARRGFASARAGNA